MSSRRSIRDVATKLVGLVPDDALDDLRHEDPATAVEMHYEPVRVHQLPPAKIADGDCSVDGYYEAFVDPDRPRILYSGEVAAERARFTIIHELGHHLLATRGAPLLDEVDRIGGSTSGASAVEEAVCHQFAGQVLVPTDLLDDVITSDLLVPNHLVRLREMASVSWEALAVRAANHANTTTAVVLLRNPGKYRSRQRTGWQHGPAAAVFNPEAP